MKEHRQWIAFDIFGRAYPLGDCGDYEAALEIADDALDDNYIFVKSVAQILDICESAMGKTDNQGGN